MSHFKRRVKNLLDKLTTNPWTAFPIFIIVVYVLFWCTFALGKYPMDWIQAGVDATGAALNRIISIEWLRDLVVDGILAGVGGVLVFLPNIIILYLMISLMESSGYLNRAAFIMDRVMHHMGLHGKSFIPMIMGFGCNVPAIMATKDISNPKSRLVTILIIPFMSCSGRLPVYLLFLAAFFPKHGPLILLGIYALGLLLAVVAAKILSLVIPGHSEHDRIAIGPYRRPDLSYVISNTWEQVREYLKKLAGPILIFSLVLWSLGYFPRSDAGTDEFKQMEQSYIGKLGQTISPVLEPIGMNWKDGVSIVAGVGAKELIVSTLGVMYSNDGDNLQDALKSSHTPASAVAFMIFVLLYFPCIGTFTALKHVSRSWGWTLGAAVNNILVAWLAAFAAFSILA